VEVKALKSIAEKSMQKQTLFLPPAQYAKDKDETRNERVGLGLHSAYFKSYCRHMPYIETRSVGLILAEYAYRPVCLRLCIGLCAAYKRRMDAHGLTVSLSYCYLLV